MKKKIISLAIAGMVSAPAFADPQVNFYGVVDAAVVTVSGSGLSSNTVVESGGPGSTHVGVNVSNDLGNGLKAIGVLEYGFNLTDNTGLSSAGARKKMIGVTNDAMGTLQAGYLPSEGYAFSLEFDPFAEGGADPMGAMINGGGFLIGWTGGANHGDHAIDYTTPDFGGFKFELGHQTANDAAGTGLVTSSGVKNNTGTLLSANYDTGPLSLGAVYATTSNTVSTNNQTEFALGASYDLTMAKLFATWQRGKYSNGLVSAADPTANNSAMSLSATIPAGPGSVAVSYAKTSMKTDSDVNGSAYAVSYGYPWSKQATLYAAYEHVSNGSAANHYSVLDGGAVSSLTGSSASSNLLALGMNFHF